MGGDRPWVLRPEEVRMRAVSGDTIAIPGTKVGDPGRVGVVLEARGPDGRPPYRVRWEDGHEAVCYPGPETRVQHDGHLDEG